jgi:post-segregation antitoxin (ccd killing protein)
MSNKVICSIYIDGDVKRKAHKIGLNISKVTENTLKILIEKMSAVDLAEITKQEPKKEKVEEVEPEEIF